MLGQHAGWETCGAAADACGDGASGRSADGRPADQHCVINNTFWQRRGYRRSARAVRSASGYGFDVGTSTGASEGAAPTFGGYAAGGPAGEAGGPLGKRRLASKKPEEEGIRKATIRKEKPPAAELVRKELGRDNLEKQPLAKEDPGKKGLQEAKVRRKKGLQKAKVRRKREELRIREER